MFATLSTIYLQYQYSVSDVIDFDRIFNYQNFFQSLQI